MSIAAFGPRFLAAMMANQSLANATPWVANTAYSKGAAVTSGGSCYVATAAVPSRAVFTPSDWLMVAAAGVAGTAGAAAPLYTGTITGDGTSTTYTVTHNLNTTSVVGQVHDPADSNALVPGVDITFPTVNTAQVILSSALASGAQLTVIIH